jgi:ABC-type branched-subunit amino acid transport system substrate-binding protein
MENSEVRYVHERLGMKKTGPFLAASILSVTSFVVTPNPNPGLAGPENTFKIVVVGWGLSSRCEGQSDTACAIYRGAMAALHSDTFSKTLTDLHLEPRLNCKGDGYEDKSQPAAHAILQLACADDKGDPALAAMRARELVTDPATLIVIGHSITGTTRAAIRTYTQAGVPVILPAATSLMATCPPHSPFLGWLGWLDPDFAEAPSSTAFRIIPNDRDGQVPAMLYALNHILHKPSKDVFVVADTRGNNKDYAVPLAERVAARLMSHPSPCVPKNKCAVIDEHGTTRDLEQGKTLGDYLTAAKAIVYAGTNRGAEPFLKENTAALAGDGKEHFVLLADGTKNTQLEDLKLPPNIHLLLTFPAPYLTEKDPDITPDQHGLIKEATSNSNQSYEMYGFDAMLMIANALKRSKLLDRRELLSLLKKSLPFQGLDGDYYSMDNGENTYVRYSLYTNYLAEASGKRDCTDPKPPTDAAISKTLQFTCTVGTQSLLRASQESF